MTSFFAPAVGLMNRLTYPRKFLLISVFVVVALVAYLFIGFYLAVMRTVSTLDAAAQQMVRPGGAAQAAYGAIGTVTNFAARLCGEAKAGQILAATRVADAVEDIIESAEVEPVTLKGFHRPMPAVDVLKLKDS